MEKTKYIVLSHGRAGTNYLNQNFRQHPEISAYNEPFHDTPAKRAAINDSKWDTTQSASQFAFDTMYNVADPAVKAVGFKLFYFQCRQNKVAADIWDTVVNDTTIKPIFVNKRNLLNRYFSELRAKASGVWHPKNSDYKTSQYGEVVDLEINIPHMMRLLARLYSSYNIIRAQFTDRPVLELFYEELGIDSEVKINQAYEFLGVEQIGQKSKFRTGTLSRETIRLINEDEVREAIENSIFRGYVETCPLLTQAQEIAGSTSGDLQSTPISAIP